MEQLQDLVSWATHEGLEIYGIKPTKIPGRGVGVVSTRKLKQGDVIVNVPIGSLRSLATLAKDIRRKLPGDTPIHGLLAADFLLKDDLLEWKAVLPQLEDFELGMPLMWPAELQALLPEQARNALAKQRERFEPQWEAFTRAFPAIARREYLYAWLIINTRTFYNETEETLAYPWEDRLALMPIADLLNHEEVGCKVAYSPDEYFITADRDYDRGEEVFISYGDHPNEYMLVEYGFVLDRNRWDVVYLDDVLYPRLGDAQRAELSTRGLLGEFALKPKPDDAPNTQTALRMACCPGDEWERFIDGREQGADVQARVDAFLLERLEVFQGDIRERLDLIESTKAGLQGQRDLLAKRWRQIADGVREFVEALKSAGVPKS